MTAPVFELRGLRARLGDAEVLHGIDLALPAGRWTSVVGPNGAGKSTLLRTLAGLLAPSSGGVWLEGRPLGAWPRKARARHLAWLGQNQGAGEDLRVIDVVMLGRLPHQTWLGAPSPADHAAVAQALHATQAWDWRERSLGALSGGERQRVLLARALAVQARVLLMDEPLANLDPPHQADWLQLVRALVGQGHTVVSVLHEIGLALHADDVLVMDAGLVTHHGASDDPATHAAIEAVFQQRIHIQPVGGQWAALARL